MKLESGMPLMEYLANGLDNLRKSERAVANVVLAKPELVISSTMAALAEAAGVSEPTVMRFSTNLGFSGFKQFKLALAQSVALGNPVTVSSVTAKDTVTEVVKKIFAHTLTSLDRARRSVDVSQLEKAIEAISVAPSVIFAGFGASGIVAADAEQKSALLGIPVSAPNDPHQQFMAVSMAPAGSVFFAISHTGNTELLTEIVIHARQNSLVTICLTGSADNKMANLVDIPLVIKTFEDTEMITPTVSRLAALVVIDALVTAVSVRRDGAHKERLANMKNDLTSFRGFSAGMVATSTRTGAQLAGVAKK